MDCAIVDMAAALSGIALWARASGMVDAARPSLFHDSPFYDVYACADGRWITLGALEPQFYALLLKKLGLADVAPKAQYDMAAWPALKARFREIFASRPSSHWRALMEGTDGVLCPGSDLCGEAAAHPHNAPRGSSSPLTADWTLRRASLRPARMRQAASRNSGTERECRVAKRQERSSFLTPPRLLWAKPLRFVRGVSRARFALPFRLDHINVYLIEDGDGLALIDAGIDNPNSRAAWEALLAGALAGRKLTRIIVTHFHPDHVGLAGWLCERFGLQLAMSETEYLIALNIRLDPSGLKSEPYRGFYRSHGPTEEATELLLGNGLQYLRMVSTPPRTFLRLVAEEKLKIGAREFEAMSGAGHSPEQLMLYSEADNFLISGDQVLAKISPNVSVEAMDPRGTRSAPICARLRNSSGRCPRTSWSCPATTCHLSDCARGLTN